MNRKYFAAITLCGLVLLASSLAAAHDLWLVPARFSVAPGESLSVALNTGDTFPASEGAVKRERIERAALITTESSAPLTSFREEEKSTVVDITAPRGPGGAIVELVLKPIATKQSRSSFDEFVKHEGLEAVAQQLAREKERREEERRTYAKYAKTLLRVGNGSGAAALYRRPLGHRLEIIPEADPFSLKRGEAFPVRLLFEGRPLAGARIVVGSTASATATQSKLTGSRTDAQGRIRLRLDESGGAHYIHALHMIPAADRTTAEWESFWATLTFEVKR